MGKPLILIAERQTRKEDAKYIQRARPDLLTKLMVTTRSCGFLFFFLLPCGWTVTAAWVTDWILLCDCEREPCLPGGPPLAECAVALAGPF